MPEASLQAGFGCAGLLTFGMALSALVIACLSYVQVQNNTATLSSSLAQGVSPEDLYGSWQPCGEVDAIMITGEQNDSFEDLDIVNLDAFLTYVFRPASNRITPNNKYLFEGDRCGFSRHAGFNASAPPLDWFGADSPTMGTLSPDGKQATFFQYFNSTAVVAPKTQPREVYIQHMWRFTAKDRAEVSIFSWYPSNDAFNAETSIWGYQGSATYKKVADYTACSELAEAVQVDPSTLPLLDYECNTA